MRLGSLMSALMIVSISTSSVHDDLSILVDQQVGYIDELIGRQEEINRLFGHVVVEYPKCKRIEAQLSEIQKKLRARLSMSGKLLRKEAPSPSPQEETETAHDTIPTLLIKEMGQIEVRPVRLAGLRDVFTQGQRQGSYTSEEALFFLKAVNNMINFLSERKAASTTLSDQVSALRDISKRNQASMLAKINIYSDDAKNELETEIGLRNMFTEAVRNVINQQKAAEMSAKLDVISEESFSSDEPFEEAHDELERIIESFIMIDEEEYDLYVITNEEIEEARLILESTSDADDFDHRDIDDFELCDERKEVV